MPAYPTGPDTGLDRLQADLKRKAAQLNAADNQIAQLTTEGAAHKAKAAEAQAAAAAARNRADDLAAQLAAAQHLLKQRDVAVTGLSQQLESARSRGNSRPGSAANSSIPTPTAVLSAKTLSRQNSDEEALHAELAGKERRISELEGELAATKARVASLTPRRRESVEDSGVAVVGGGSLSSYDANRLRSLRAEADEWRDKADGLMAQMREMQRQLQASDIEKSQLADQCATLSEKVTALESELKASRESLTSLRAVADQGRGDMRSQLQRKESDLARAAAAADAAAQQADDLRHAAEKATLERERLALQVQQLQAQLAKRGEDARDREARVTALLAQMDEKSAALEAAQAELKNVSGGKWGAEAHLSDLQGRVEGLNKEKAEVEGELRRTADALAAAEAEKEALEAALREHRSRGDGAVSAADALRAQLAEKRKEIDLRERRLAEAAAALDDKQLELDEYQRSTARGSESHDALAQKLAAVAAQLANTKAELAQRNATLADLSTELELTREEASNSGKAAEDATSALRAGQGAIDRSRAFGSEEIAQLKGFLAKATERNEELQGKIEARDAEIASLGARMSKMEDLQRQKHELSQKVLEGEGALRSAAGDAAGVSAELDSAREALAARQAALEAARSALGAVERKATGLEQDLRQAQAALATVEAQLSDRDERLMEQERRLDAVAMEVADLKNELRTGEMARQDLQREVDASRLEVLHLQSSVRGLEGETEAAQKRVRGLTDDLEDARAPFQADQEAKRQLADTLAELAAERAAHATTKQLLVAEAATVAVPAAAAVQHHETGAASQQQEEATEEEPPAAAAVEAAFGSLQLDDAEQAAPEEVDEEADGNEARS